MDLKDIRNFSTDPTAPERIWRGSCEQCHAFGADEQAPQLDYRAALENPKFREFVRSGRMPPDQKLTVSQKAHLIRASEEIQH